MAQQFSSKVHVQRKHKDSKRYSHTSVNVTHTWYTDTHAAKHVYTLKRSEVFLKAHS